MGIDEKMISTLCGYLSSGTAVPAGINSQMMNYYRQYLAIGSMPEAVQKYIDTMDFREVDKIQRALLQCPEVLFKYRMAVSRGYCASVQTCDKCPV